VWIFTGPLVSAGLFTFVFGNVAKLGSDGIPYFAFSYAGLLGWTLFTSILSGASGSLNSNSSLISKIYFPRLVLPLSSTASTLINTAISLVIMLVVLVVYDIGFSARMLLLPFWLLLAISLAMGLGLVVTSVAVKYRDVNYVTSVFTSLLLYLSPVAYSVSAVPASVRPYYQLNPITTIVDGCRWSLLGSNNLSPWGIAYTVAVTVVALIGGAALFTRLEWGFADVI
jgi:lipopolysaccharide transport system permease protein